MKNITVALEDEIYRRARIKAAEEGSSVSALVKAFFRSLLEGESDYDRRKLLEKRTLARIKTFRAGDRLDREELHKRHALS